MSVTLWNNPRADREWPNLSEEKDLTISEIIEESHSNSVNKGWWGPEMQTADHPFMIQSLLQIIDICHRVEEYRKTGVNTETEAWTEEVEKLRPNQLFLQKALLIITEVVEAVEEHLDGRGFDEIYTSDKGKIEGVSSELGDVVIRIADACGFWGIPLNEALQKKASYNRTREFKHGKVV